MITTLKSYYMRDHHREQSLFKPLFLLLSVPQLNCSRLPNISPKNDNVCPGIQSNVTFSILVKFPWWKRAMQLVWVRTNFDAAMFDAFMELILDKVLSVSHKGSVWVLRHVCDCTCKCWQGHITCQNWWDYYKIELNSQSKISQKLMVWN